MVSLDIPFKTRKSAGVPVSKAVRALIDRGDQARNSKDWPEAAVAYQDALAQDPSLSHIWIQLGHALKESGRLADSEAAYRQAIALTPMSSDPFLHLGHVLKLQGEMEHAIGAYSDALERSPENQAALDELVALAQQGLAMPKALLRKLQPVPDAPASNTATLQGQARAALRALQVHLGGTGGEPALIQALEQAQTALSAQEAKAPANGRAIIFDATDLIRHFRQSRVPTGIQRVQLAILQAQIAQAPTTICCLLENGWVRVPNDLFRAICDTALATRKVADRDWTTQLQKLMLGLAISEPFSFPKRAWLVSLGTSWDTEYLLHVRTAKQTHGIKFVPFIHDLIPVKRPEFCVRDLTQDYLGWLLGVLQFADGYLTNSESTLNDLTETAKRLGHPISPDRITVTPLDAAFGTPEPTAPREQLRSLGLERTAFVLLVSTLEPRKNHIAAFAAWEELVRRHGPAKVPQLVCVGQRGWLNEALFAKIEASAVLRDHVVILHDIPDADLRLLYQHCLFTLYPSHYEGWGLPITESLCHGKVPVVADNSSLPEACSGFGEVFPTGADDKLIQAIERLLLDVDYRAAKEQSIREGFQPRSWGNIAQDIDNAVAGWLGRPSSAIVSPEGLRLTTGRYYTVGRNLNTDVSADTTHGSLVRLGDDWHRTEDWGCWSRGKSLAVGGLVGPVRSGRLAVYLKLRGQPGRACSYRAEFSDGMTVGGRIPENADHWLTAAIDWPRDCAQMLKILLGADATYDMADKSEGRDRRLVGLGVAGLYVCDAIDINARLNIMEAVAFGNLDQLSRGPLEPRAPLRGF